MPLILEINDYTQYVDKQVSMLRATLNNNVLSVDCILKRITELDNKMRTLKFEYEQLMLENKEIKKEISDLKLGKKQTTMEDYSR